MKPRYEVVSPLGEPAARQFGSAGPISDLSGKRIGLIWSAYVKGDILAEALADLLERRFPGIEFSKLPTGRGAEWGAYPDHSLTELVSESGIDAAIVTIGC